MRKNFIILFFTLISILPSFSYANVNVHPVGSQAWHNFNDSMLWGQLEADRQKREREEAERQRQAQQPYVEPDINIVRSVFVWSDKTGNCYYLPCGSQEIGWFAKKKL